MAKDTVGKVERSVVRDDDGHTTGVDYTRHHSDGSSETKHYEADDTVFGPHEGTRTGVTDNNADGTSTYHK